MTWACNFSHMLSIYSFEAAENLFKKIDRPGGTKWAENARPLDGHRKTHVALIKHNEDCYSARLYKTDMVTWKRGGNVGVQLHHTQSSSNFLHRMLPSGMSMQYSCMLKVDTPEGPIWVRQADASSIVFEPAGRHLWTLVGGAQQRRRIVSDRKKMAAARKTVAPFLFWCDTMNKLYGRVPVALHWDNEQLLFAIKADARSVWPNFRSCATDRKSFMEAVYRYFDCYTEVEIPNSTPPPTKKQPFHRLS